MISPQIKTNGYCGVRIAPDFLDTIDSALEQAVKHYGTETMVKAIRLREERDRPTKPKQSGETKTESDQLPLHHITIVGPKEWSKFTQKADFLQKLSALISRDDMSFVFKGIGTELQGEKWTLWASLDRDTPIFKYILALREAYGLTEVLYPHATLAFNVQDLHVNLEGNKLNKSEIWWINTDKSLQDQEYGLVKLFSPKHINT